VSSHKVAAWLYFRPVYCEIPDYAPPAVAQPLDASVCSRGDVAGLASTGLATEAETSPVIVPYYDHSVRYVLGPADLDQSVIATNPKPSVVLSEGNTYEVEVNFNPAGAFDAVAAKRYASYRQNPQNPPYESLEAIEVDGVIFSAPTIQAPSFNGVAVISRSAKAPFTLNQARLLADAIFLATQAKR
jgi:hypothetical protein